MQQNDLYMLAAADCWEYHLLVKELVWLYKNYANPAEKLDNSTSQFYAVTGEYAGDELGEFNNIGLSTAEADLKKITIR